MLTYSPVELYHLAMLLFPENCRGRDFVPIVIEGQAMELRYSSDRGHGDDVEFLLHFPNTHYARRSLIVYNTGRMREDTAGIVPDWDKLPGEVALTSPAEQFAPVIFDVLLMHLRKTLDGAPDA